MCRHFHGTKFRMPKIPLPRNNRTNILLPKGVTQKKHNCSSSSEDNNFIHFSHTLKTKGYKTVSPYPIVAHAVAEAKLFSDVHNVRPPFSDIFVRFYVCSSINKLFHAVHIPVCSRADLPWKSMGWVSYERKIYIIKASAKCKGEEEMEDRSAGKVLETSCWKQQAPILKPYISPSCSLFNIL